MPSHCWKAEDRLAESVEAASIHFNSLSIFMYMLSVKTKLPTVCPQICDTLLDSVNSAAHVFRFKDIRVTVAFLCSCSPDDRHMATPTEDHRYLRCTLSNVVNPEPLTGRHRVWLTTSSSGVLLKCSALCSFLFSFLHELAL